MAAIDAFAGNDRELSGDSDWPSPSKCSIERGDPQKITVSFDTGAAVTTVPELEMVHLKIALLPSRIRKELKKVRVFGCVFGRVSHMKSWRKTFSRMDVTKSTEQLQQDGRDQKYRTASAGWT